MFQNNFQNLSGSLLAARYAYMPNKLKYCGGDSNSEIFAYLREQAPDDGLNNLLKEFETMYPYLKLIAEANKIYDPFNCKVVEAYWIGNELLDNVSMDGFYRGLVDKQKLKKKFESSLLEKVFGKIPLGAKPHHNFHVFNIPKRTGHYPVEHSLKTMDECRIANGRIINYELRIMDTEIIKKIKVKYEPLIINDNQIKVGASTEKEVWAESSDMAYSKKLEVGDWVAIHWGWICDVLTEKQASNLRIWTEFNLGLVNFNL